MCRRLTQDRFQQRTEHGHRHTRMRNLPAHEQHQEKAEKHETQRHQAILDADHLVVGGKDIFLPKPRLVMFLVAMRFVCVRRLPCAKRGKLLNFFLHKKLFHFVADQRRNEER